MRLAATALFLLAACAASPPAADAAPPGELVLTGHAQTGADTRVVRFGLACSGSGPGVSGALSITLAVPRPEQLAGVFAFDPFEGPDANAGPLTQLQSSVAGADAQGTFKVAGSFGVDPDTPFVFDLAAAISQNGASDDAARLAAMAGVLRPLAKGPGKLVWRQGNTTQGGVPIVASLDVAASDSARLRELLAPCLAAAR